MLSIGKLAKGQEGYYLDAVARGVEDYYLEGEAPGRWVGAGTALLGLADEVDADALAAVLDGRDPTTDTRLRSSKGGRIPGFDLTFRAPKSVSVVFGLAEADIAAVVAEAHDLAVEGMTCDRAFLLATDDLYQELGYVALSRGRLGNHIVTVGELAHDLESPPHAPMIERDSLDVLRSGLSTSRAQQLAIDLDRAAHFSSMPSADLIRERRRLAEVIGRAPADRTADLPELIAARDFAERRPRQLQHEHSRVHLPGRSRGQSRAERERAIDRVTADVAEHATAVTRAEESTTLRSRYLVEHATEVADLRHIDDIVARRIDETVIEAEDDGDHYLRRAVGAPPVGSRRREVWRERARAVERYRMTYAITDQDKPLGLKPRDTQQLIAYWGVIQEAKVIQPELALKKARRIGRGLA